ETEHVLQANDASEQRQKAFHLHEDLGDLFALVGEQERARAIFQRGFDFLSKIDIVRGARLYRKIGLSHSVQRHFGASEEAFANAERILDEGAANPDPPWWEEKLQIPTRTNAAVLLAGNGFGNTASCRSLQRFNRPERQPNAADPFPQATRLGPINGIQVSADRRMH